MNCVLLLLHDFDIKKQKAISDASKARFEYLHSLLCSLIEIVAIEKSINSSHAKRIMLESFCFNAKRILDQFKIEFKDSIYFEELKKIRNILAHDVITYCVNDNGISFNNYEKGMEIYYRKYYFNNDGTINISNFMLYNTLLLAREIRGVLSEEIFSGLKTNDQYLMTGINMLSEYEFNLDKTHDEYMENVSSIYDQPENSIEFSEDHEKYLKVCLRALSWMRGKESEFPVDYFHIQTSLSLYSKDTNDSTIYANNAESLINELKFDYNFLPIYLIHIYANLSKRFFHRKDKRNSLLYALKLIKICNSNTVKLLDRIIFYTDLANAYSLYNSKRECMVLLRCLDMIDEAVNDNYKNIHNYQLMVIGNILDCFASHQKGIPDHIMNYVQSIYKSNIPKIQKNNLKKKVINYHLRTNHFHDAIDLVAELINKEIVVGNEKLHYEITQLYLKHLTGTCIQLELKSLELKMAKIEMNKDEERGLHQNFNKLKQVASQC